jgi:hypothetical protein
MKRFLGLILFLASVFAPAQSAPPTVTLVSPTYAEVVTVKTYITLDADVYDDVSIQTVIIYILGYDSCVVTAPSYSCQWLVPAAPHKEYTIVAYAEDTDGQWGVSNYVDIITARPR